MTDGLLSWLRSTIEGDKADASTLPHGPWYREGVYPQRISNAEAILIAETCTNPSWRPDIADHIIRHDPRDTIARCEAELAELDAIEAIPHQRVIDDEWFSCSQARDEYGGLSCYNDARRGEPCDCGRDAFVDRMTRAKVYGYRHRSGYRPEWAPEGAAL